VALESWRPQFAKLLKQYGMAAIILIPFGAAYAGLRLFTEFPAGVALGLLSACGVVFGVLIRIRLERKATPATYIADEVIAKPIQVSGMRWSVVIYYSSNDRESRNESTHFVEVERTPSSSPKMKTSTATI
jgi:hypothetical protein